MKFLKWTWGSVVVLVLSGCSGGGSTPSDPGSRDIKLTKSNVPDVAEVLRQDIVSGVHANDALRYFYGGGLPQFNFPNNDTTYACNYSGTVRIVTRSAGAEVDEYFAQCSDYAGSATNGRISYKFESVNSSENSYSLLVTADAYKVTLSSGAFYSEDGTLRLDAILKSSTVDLTIASQRTITDPGLPEAYTSTATYTVSYPNLGYAFGGDLVDLKGMSGRLSLASSGRVSLSWNSSGRTAVLAGIGSERGYMSLVSDRFGLDFDSGSGSMSGIAVSESSFWMLDVFSTTNTAPTLTAGSKKQVSKGSAGTLPLHNWLSDREFDVLDVTATVVSSPSGAVYHLGQQTTGFAIPFNADTAGDYTLRLVARDPAGLMVTGNIVIEVAQDFDGDGIPDLADPDDDNDGVNDAADAFPFDSTEALDTDRDGMGNNADPDDDNDGVLDAADSFPLQAMCQAPTDGENGICTSTRIAVAQSAAIDSNGVMYFLDANSKRVIRWSTVSNRLLPSVAIGSAVPSDSVVQQMIYSSAHNRLYFGYDKGSITYLDLAQPSPIEVAFQTLPMSVRGLVAVGSYVLAQDESGAWATHYIMNVSGAITDHRDWNYYSRVYAWDAVNSRVYFLRDDSSPNDLHYEVINQATGMISGQGETPYHGAYLIEPPIVVSQDGQNVLLGSGDIYTSTNLNWAGAIPSGVGAGVWTSADGLVTGSGNSVATTIERRSAALAIQERVNFSGQLKWLFRSASGYKVVTVIDGDARIFTYTPSNDSDGDGVANTLDAFPLDRAASQDSDHDGYPDSWNTGRSQADSTSGLTLDAYPNDSACHLVTDGDGTNCDYNRVIPAFIPDKIVGDGSGIIYLLSSDNYRVYRWSMAAHGYISPLVVGSEQAINAISPTLMEYSPAHGRLYFGYENGNATYIDLAQTNGAESSFATIAQAVRGIGAAGDKVLLQDPSGAWATHYIYDSSGHLLDSKEWNYYSRAYAWDASLNRIYFFRDDMSPDDLHYEQLDPVSGEIVASGETPYHGNYQIAAPILVSPDGNSVLIGSGDIYAADTLVWKKALASSFQFGTWLANGKVVTLRAFGANSRIDIYDSNQNWTGESDISGAPRGIYELSGKIHVVTDSGSGLVYTELPLP